MAKLYPPLEVIKKRKPEATLGERALLSFLLNNYNDEYEIFFQPFLNGDLPDIILMHKGGGVMVFEVKDWDLSNYHVNEVGKWIVNVNDSVNSKTPFNQVLKYKENLYNLHIDSLLDLKLKDYKHWYIVNCAVYFHCQSEKEVIDFCYGKNPTDKYKNFLDKNFSVFEDYCVYCHRRYPLKDWKDKKCPNCGNNQKKYSLILGKDSLRKSHFDKLFDKTWISRESRYFTEELYNSFARILKPSYHTIEEGLDIKLSSIQQELSISKENERKRIKGVAGSGKTLVLAQRAVNAHKRIGGMVLILTYNITLKNYIHDRISAVRDSFAWEFFNISNYHDFINSNLNNVGIGFDFLEKDDEGKTVYTAVDEKVFDEQVYSNIHLFNGHKDQLPKYDAIFIDETQDYKENWIRIIKDNFANETAEIVAFADEKQNIYSRDLDSTKMPNIPIQVGQWDRRLNKSYRLSNKIALLATDFQRKFFANKYIIEDKIETNSMLSLFDEPLIEYHHISSNNDGYIANYIFKQIMEHQFNSNDVTILSSRIKMLRELNSKLQENSKEKTNIMFETEEEFRRLCPNAQSGYEKNKEIEKIRKNRKANFWMNRGTFKLSTIHSFKGWESPVLFLVVEDNIKNYDNLIQTESQGFKPIEFSDELVYTGFTRCRNFLFIVNINNEAYHDFFNNSKLVDKKK
ncbi:nuclease [Bacteroidia bacterium]|nr:nuclease [Bacteroidia bacterium]